MSFIYYVYLRCHSVIWAPLSDDHRVTNVKKPINTLAKHHKYRERTFNDNLFYNSLIKCLKNVAFSDYMSLMMSPINRRQQRPILYLTVLPEALDSS